MNQERVLIYGNGAMARVLYSFVRKTANVCGFTVDDTCISEGDATFCGLPLIPFSNVCEVFPPRSCRVITAIGYMEMNELRRCKHIELQARGYRFSSFVHDSVVRHDDVEIGENCIVLDHVAIHPGCRIGDGTFIASNASLGHDCIVEEFNWINSGVALAGGCHVGAGCFFGVNSSVAHGVNLGNQNFISANTLISRSTGNTEVYLSGGGEKFRLNSHAFLRFSPGMGR